jgi:hypothetical protein
MTFPNAIFPAKFVVIKLEKGGGVVSGESGRLSQHSLETSLYEKTWEENSDKSHVRHLVYLSIIMLFRPSTVSYFCTSTDCI